MCILRILVLSFMFIVSGVNASSTTDILSALGVSEQAPKIYEHHTHADGMQSFYFEGAKYQGNSTRIFAYYKTPEGTGPFPAIVLVHGGGGSAFAEWVEKWNQAGFAAISIATEGQTGTLTGQRQPKWVKHKWGGPRRPGIYNDAEQPLSDQWMNQVTTATIQAHNLLRSFANIQQDQIGISGISWGGVITSTVIGFDQRFAFAIPIYGCGFLDTMDSKYGKALKHNQSYKDVWEPALRIANYTAPTLWLTGLKENNFSLDAQANTYRLVSGAHYQSIQENLKHSHKAGWAPVEAYQFAQSVIGNKNWPSFSQYEFSKNKVSIQLNDIQNITTSSLFYTEDIGHTHTRQWQEITVNVERVNNKYKLAAPLPPEATGWIFNVNSDGIIHSSEFYERLETTKSAKSINNED